MLVFPHDPKEAFEMSAAAFDLADRLQTPVFVMMDLDIGMNQRLCDPLDWDDSRRYDRGKVMTRQMLERGEEFARYLDVENDGIGYRTYPGTHPTEGAYFTRGTTKDSDAEYSEAGPDYVENMQRLLRKFDTAKELIPKPIRQWNDPPSKFGVIYYGSTSPAMAEAFDALKSGGINIDGLRIRAFPFTDEVDDFITTHEHVFIVEQNRDAQMRTLLVNELGLDPAKFTPVLHYDGTPITARFIASEIAQRLVAAGGHGPRSAAAT